MSFERTRMSAGLTLTLLRKWRNELREMPVAVTLRRMTYPMSGCMSKMHVWIASSVALTIIRMYFLIGYFSRDSHCIFLVDWLIVVLLTGTVFAMIADKRIVYDMSHAGVMFTAVGVNIWMLFFEYIGDMFPICKL